MFNAMYKTAVGAPLVVSALLVSAAPNASAQTFTEGAISGGNWSDTVGQNFIVGLEPSPDPGLVAGDPVKLTEFLTFRAGAGFGDPDADVFLAITEGAYFDWNGDPDGSFVPTVADVLAVSANSFNPSTLAAGDPMAFTFGGGVDVLYGGMYAAAYVTIDASNNVTPIVVGSLIGDWVLDELQGIWVPTQNHGVEDDFNASALYADFDGEGSLDGCQFACDMSFLATFSVASALEGDLDQDGFVGITDLNLVLGDWNAGPPTDPKADPSGDNFVGIEDLNTVLGNWNAGTPPTVATVPEPLTGVVLACLLGLPLAGKRQFLV
jgi:hypothetical protein